MVNPSLRRVALLCALLGSGWAVHAQTLAPTPNLRIVALGGFLGYVDGLVDPKVLDQAAGGIYGVEEWLKKQADPANPNPDFVRGRDLLLITGNNKALDASQARLAGLAADAVAVSIDDFLRGLRLPDRAAPLVRELRDNRQPAFVASNVIVRIRKHRLNSIEGKDIDLEIKRDESIGWVGALKASCQPCPETVTATIAENPPVTGSRPFTAEVKRSYDTRHLAITIKPNLRPGHRYTLTLLAAGRAGETFQFETHESLTHPRATDLPAGLESFSVQYAARDLGGAPATPIIIFGAVNPDLKKELGADRWKWKQQANTAAACGQPRPPNARTDITDECEIDFIQASEAFKAIRSQLEPADDTKPRPLFVMLSGLTDMQTLALVSDAADIRFVVLDPDSSVLGRELGDESVVNRSNNKTTQLWARPEWVGKQAEILSADMNWDASETPKVWRMAYPDVQVVDISGERLDSRRDPAGRQVEYFLKRVPAVKLGGPFPVYPPTPMVDASKAPGSLWVTREGTAALILDQVRHELAADIAMLPSRAVDIEIVDWLAAEARTKPLDWMSQFILEKLIYQMEHFVSVNVEGSKLADTLDTIVKAEAEGEGNGQLFASGLGVEGVLAVDKGHLRVNERAIMPTHFYRVAMPLSMAERQKLKPSGSELASILDSVDLRLRKAVAADVAMPRIGEFLDRAAAKRPRYYFNLTPAQFEFHRARVQDPESILGSLPLAGRSVSAEEQWKASGIGDLGMDFPGYAFRATANLDYAKKTIATVSINPKDEWTIGGRFDWKVEKRLLDRIFIGYFSQSWFRNHVEQPLTPSRTVVNAVGPDGTVIAKATVKGEPVTPHVQKPLYRFVRVGTDFPSKVTPWLTFKDMTVAFDTGKAYRDRTDVTIGTETRPIAGYFKSPSKFLESLFEARPSLFAVPQDLTFVLGETRKQQRIQADGAAEFSVAKWMKLTTSLQYRVYLDDQRPDFTPNRSLDLKTKLELTKNGRVKVGPFINVYRVKAKGVPEVLSYRDFGIGIDVPLFFRFGRTAVLQ